MTVVRPASLNQRRSPRVTLPPSLDPALLRAWLVVLAGTAIVALSAFALMPESRGGLGSLPLFIAVMIAGHVVVHFGTRMLKSRTRDLPKEDFARSLLLRRTVVIAAQVSVLAAHLPLMFLPLPWNITLYLLLYLSGPLLLASFLMPYQTWVLGPAKALDEYHLGRRLLARSRAYAGLAIATLAVFAVCAITQWLPSPRALPILGFFYLWMILSLPCCVLAWTEPDPDAS